MLINSQKSVIQFKTASIWNVTMFTILSNSYTISGWFLRKSILFNRLKAE